MIWVEVRMWVDVGVGVVVWVEVRTGEGGSMREV